MSVFRNTYRPYTGDLTPTWSRFLILPRYAWQRVFSSKLLTAFFVACFLWPLGAAVIIYLHHNLRALDFLNLSALQLVLINTEFFLVVLTAQGTFAFLLTVFVGPGLISADLANNGLPLYLCRPFSRAEYVLGKMSVLAGLLSLVTWIPCLLLFLLQWSLARAEWFSEYWRIGPAILLGSWIWILVISLLSLALSAWVKWKLAAGALLMGVFFVTAGFGEAINSIFETDLGYVINIGELIKTVWAWLFGVPLQAKVPITSAWSALLGICAGCISLLARRVRAYEVAR